MNSPELLLLVENCPKGAETLVTRCLHILTDKGKRHTLGFFWARPARSEARVLNDPFLPPFQFLHPQSWWSE